MQSKEHWERVYTTKSATEVSWFQQHAELSMELIRAAGIPTSASIIDVGGGASTLVDDLLAHHFEHITVLDLSAAALSGTKMRLGKNASTITWLEANVLEADLPQHSYDLWHDRAVFHFLTNEQDRDAYVQQASMAMKPGGIIIVATFAEDGPTSCSGLPVMRYNAEQLYAVFSTQFQLIDHKKESHYTPNGTEQKFTYCICQKKA